MALKGIVQAKMVKMIKYLFFAQEVSSGMGALRQKILINLESIEKISNR